MAGSGSTGKAKPGDIRAGGAFYEIYAKDGVSGVLETIKGKIAGFASFMRRTGALAMGASAAMGAGPLAFLYGGMSRAAGVAQAAEFSQAIAIPIEVMNKLQFAADRAGVSVGEVMNDHTGRFRNLIAQAPAIDPAEAKQALQTQWAFKDATRALQDAMLGLMGYIAPVVKDVAKFVKENAAGITVVAAVAAGIFAFGAALSALGTGISIITIGVKLLFAGVMMMLSPFGLVIGLVGVWAMATEKGRAAAGELGKAFKDIGETFSATWKGITDAVKGGDLKLAFEIAGVGITLVWHKMLNAMGKAFAAFIEDNRVTIVTLAAIWGGMKAARLVPGPLGFVAAGLGAGAAALGADALVDKMAGLGDNPKLDAKIAEGEKKLADLGRRAAEAAAGAAPKDDPYRDRPFVAVKGGFNVGSAQQQFGYGDVNQTTEMMKQIAENTKKAAVDIAILINKLMLR